MSSKKGSCLFSLKKPLRRVVLLADPGSPMGIYGS